MKSGFKFSERSKARMQGIDPMLYVVTCTALDISKVDFGITEGVRSKERQKELFDSGKSQTLKSKHLRGWAVDVAAYVEGKLTWDLSHYVDIANAFRQSSILHDTPIRWGAAWLAPLADYESAEYALEDYLETRKSEGRKPFIDGPHFEMWGTSYVV